MNINEQILLLEQLTKKRVFLIEQDQALSKETINYLKNIKVEDLTLVDKENGDEVDLIFSLPKFNFNQYAEVKLEATRLELNQIHIFFNPKIQGLGLAPKIYKRIIQEFGYIYSGKGRQQNQEAVPAIWNKLKNDPELEYYENELGQLLTLKRDFEWKQDIIKSFNGK